MAGHSKWANIRHRKATQDAKKGKTFTKIIRELTIAARGGPFPEDNPRLRLALEKARAVNMPRDTVNRAVARGSGTDDAEQLEEVTYEGYGPGGVALLLEALTDNRNRTVADVRHIFSKAGGSLGTDGSVAYMFQRRGEIIFVPGADQELVIETAAEASAQDLQSDEDGSLQVITSVGQFEPVLQALSAKGLVPSRSELTMYASSSVSLEPEQSRRVIDLVNALEDLEDVQAVHTNAELSATVLAEISE